MTVSMTVSYDKKFNITYNQDGMRLLAFFNDAILYRFKKNIQTKDYYPSHSRQLWRAFFEHVSQYHVVY